MGHKSNNRPTFRQKKEEIDNLLINKKTVSIWLYTTVPQQRWLPAVIVDPTPDHAESEAYYVVFGKLTSAEKYKKRFHFGHFAIRKTDESMQELMDCVEGRRVTATNGAWYGAAAFNGDVSITSDWNIVTCRRIECFC